MPGKGMSEIGLKTRMIGSAILGVLALVLILYMVLGRTERNFINGKYEERKALTALLADRMNHELSMIQESLKRIADERKTFLMAPISVVDEQFNRTRESIEQKHFNNGLFLLGADYSIINVEHTEAHFLNQEIVKYLKRKNISVTEKEEVYVLSLPNVEYPVMVFVQPITFPGLNRGEFLIGALDMTEESLQRAIDIIRPGKTGYVSLMDEQDYVIFSDKLRRLKKKSPHADLIHLARKSGGTVIEQEEGEETVAAATVLPATGWSLLVEQDTKEFYGYILGLKKTLASLAIILSAVFVVFNIIISGTLVKPILSLSRRARNIARGELEPPIIERGPGEIGILANSMEEMRKNLQTLLAKLKVHQIELEREVRAKTERSRALNELFFLFNQTPEIDELINKMLGQTMELLRAQYGALYLLEEDGRTLKMTPSAYSIAPLRDRNLGIEEGLTGEAIREGRALSTDMADYKLERYKKYFLEKGIKTLASVPLYSKGKLLGALSVASRHKEAFSAGELDFLDSIASVVSSAMENALLFEQLRTVKVEWETTFDSITDLITIQDLDYTIVRANRAVFKLLDLPPNEVLGKKWHEVFQEHANGPSPDCPMTKLIKSNEDRPFYTENRVIKGLDFKISVFPLKSDEGELQGIVHVASNITDQKKLIEALEFRAKSTSILNELIKAVNSSLELDIITTNLIEELRKIFPVDRISLGRYLKEEDAFCFTVYQDLMGKLKSGKEYIIEAEQSPSMKRVWENTETYYCRDMRNASEPLDLMLRDEGLNSYLSVPVIAEGETIATINLCDRTEGRFSEQEIIFLEDLANHFSVAMKNAQLYERLERAHEELKSMHLQVLQAEKLSSMGKLSAGTAHEILNPLNIISMQAQIMEMDWMLDEEQQKAIASILSQVDRIKKIADGLRTFSRQYKMRGEIKLNINNLIEDSLSLIAHDLKVNNINVEKDLEHELPKVLADKDQLTQVILNIMMNARDAMPEGGTLSIRSAASNENSKRAIELEFSDTGMGIPEEILPNIFDPFFTTKSEDKGTGLGLSICYGIVEKMGGKIRVKSANGKGSAFNISLPA